MLDGSKNDMVYKEIDKLITEFEDKNLDELDDKETEEDFDTNFLKVVDYSSDENKEEFGKYKNQEVPSLLLTAVED
ncbi:1660_t:CDS:2, partial [Rhizophagus irregularis]